jgi:hypothetical protein
MTPWRPVGPLRQDTGRPGSHPSPVGWPHTGERYLPQARQPRPPCGGLRDQTSGVLSPAVNRRPVGTDTTTTSGPLGRRRLSFCPRCLPIDWLSPVRPADDADAPERQRPRRGGALPLVAVPLSSPQDSPVVGRAVCCEHSGGVRNRPVTLDGQPVVRRSRATVHPHPPAPGTATDCRRLSSPRWGRQRCGPGRTRPAAQRDIKSPGRTRSSPLEPGGRARQPARRGTTVGESTELVSTVTTRVWQFCYLYICI